MERQEWIVYLCKKIDMPIEAIKQIEAQIKDIDLQEWDFAKGLLEKEQAEQTWKKLKERIEEDTDGWKILAIMLATVQGTCDQWTKEKLPQQIQWETLKTFSRFVKEHKKETDRYGFDRDFWTWRQLCGQILRLGSLEYEDTTFKLEQWEEMKEGDRCIMIHIPSDASLEEIDVQDSIQQAKMRWGEDVPFFCESWLMASCLDSLLPEGSRLKKFRARFERGTEDLSNDSYIRWVFNNSKQAPENWQARTSLQQAIQKHILQGGKIGTAWARLKSL